MSLIPCIERPAVSHPNAVAAMEDAVRRLRGLLHWEQWITFVALGHSNHPKDYKLAEIRVLGDSLDVGPRPLDVAHIIQAARVGESSLVADHSYYSVAAASAQEVAQILDAIFRYHFGLRPFPGDGGDYPVGAEWRNEPHGFSA